MGSVAVRPFALSDMQQVYALWCEALGARWPLPVEALRAKLTDARVFHPGDHLIAEVGGEAVGFAATQLCSGGCGALTLLMVAPAWQWRGVGRRLHDLALCSLAERGATEVGLGAGGISYLWPGVPTNLPSAWPFFAEQGWTETERSFDLAGGLSGYATPNWVYQRIEAAGVRLEAPESDDLPALLDFVERHIPRWRTFYESEIASGGAVDIIIAKSVGNQVVGASYAMDGRRARQRYDFCVWQQLLGDGIGGIGPLLVDDAVRERGIGLALAARVTERLKAKGLRTGFVGYTWLVDWYGRLGYRVWREYRMSRPRLVVPGA